MRIAKAVVFAVGLALSMGAMAAEKLDPALQAVTKEKFDDQAAAIRQQMKPGGRWEFVDSEERSQVNARLDEIASLLATAASADELTREAVELTQNAQSVGADACLLVTPYYNKPTQEGLYQHFRHIAEHVAIPQILYNVPGRTACDMLPETVERLSKVSNIIGIKEATGDLQRAQEILDRVSADFLVYSGDDATAVELMLMGGKGNISVTANVAPRAMAELCAAAMAGDAATSRAINERLMPLHKNLFIESNPIPVKWALHEMGMMQDGIRLPLTWLSPRCHEPLRQAMRQSGVLA